MMKTWRKEVRLLISPLGEPKGNLRFLLIPPLYFLWLLKSPSLKKRRRDYKGTTSSLKGFGGTTFPLLRSDNLKTIFFYFN
jgi:hypothetical protein